LVVDVQSLQRFCGGIVRSANWNQTLKTLASSALTRIIRTTPAVMDIVNGTLHKKHVLIVDDDIPLAWSLKESLESDGYDATIVPDGGLALKFVLQHQLDAVVCDLQMSGVEGDLFYATVGRTNPSLARRFVFIIGLDERSQFQKFLDSVELPVLCKPVALDTLRGEVMRVAERN
jgi:CheY-like chemotaxis protein